MSETSDSPSAPRHGEGADAERGGRRPSSAADRGEHPGAVGSERGGGVYDVIVIGAGPGGYTAAIRAARAGLRTALVEAQEIGGVCLNWGCIPTKAMLHSAALWRSLRGGRRHGITVGEAGFDYAAVVQRSRQTVSRLVKGLELTFKEVGLDLVRGHARLDGRDGPRIRVKVASSHGDGTGGQGLLRAAHVILASGSRIRGLPHLPFDGERILHSRDAIVLTEVPERLLIVGGGAIGLEFADLFATFGARVTVVELLPRILPTEDEEVSAALRSALLKRGIKIRTGCTVSEVTPVAGPDGKGLRCVLRAASADVLEVDRVLVAVGVTGATADLGLETVGVTPEEGFLKVDGHLRTSAPGLYAIGDLVGPPLLAHTASSQGIHAAEHAAGKVREEEPYDATWTPAAVFTHPQVASVGLREHDLAARGLKARVGRFPFSASGKAVAEGDVAGFVKVLLEEATGRLLGAHIIGPAASELIAELTLAGRNSLKAEDVLRTIHTHPTLSEALPEAVGAALGIGIHG